MKIDGFVSPLTSGGSGVFGTTKNAELFGNSIAPF
jgi:hypothetical protein